MTKFLRLLNESEKAPALMTLSARVRGGSEDVRIFDVEPDAFDAVPGKPFAYWVSNDIRQKFLTFKPLAQNAFLGKGPDTGDDFRFLRAYWECDQFAERWMPHPKGGVFSRFYSDIHLCIDWLRSGALVEMIGNMRNFSYMGRPGLTWSRRTTSNLSVRVMPRGCVFADKGPAGFLQDDSPAEILFWIAVCNSKPFAALVELQLAAADAAARSYEVGVLQRTPVPDFDVGDRGRLAELARRAWSLKRTLDTVVETSLSFMLPTALRSRLGGYNPTAIEVELAQIQSQIDSILFRAYGFSDAEIDILSARDSSRISESEDIDNDDEGSDQGDGSATDELLSWAVGVVFGRFDLLLATGERYAPAEPNPFDQLPAKSPGMLPNGADFFHAHTGILVDDPGHKHDLTRLVERVLERADVQVPADLRMWLQRDFFPFHLQRYSKSRRKAPIYWPLSTASGSYTLWLYYPTLSRQTLYTAINDFVDPKLTDVVGEADQLRAKGSTRPRNDEKRLELLATLEAELRDLRDQLQAIATHYQPNQNDGVQITATPLWPLFRHKPWQKVLKDTWAKLEKGDYDWSHLAMSYWSGRVREKCKSDKSLAIAHGLEELYAEPEGKPKKGKGRKGPTA